MNSRMFTAFALAAVVSSVACDRSATEAQEKANKAQAEANKDIAEANQEAKTKITSAQVEADKKIAEAQKNFATNVENYRHEMQGKVDTLDKKLADLEIKAKKSTGKTKANIEANLPTLRTRRDAFVNDLRTIETTSATSWDATKARLDKQWTDLKDAADKVD
jgi:regulator of protease activity HflC (stomatin/prohibitin superfamily)